MKHPISDATERLQGTPPIFTDKVYSRIVIKFDWWDRFRVLLGCEVELFHGMKTQYMPGQVEFEPTEVRVARIFKRRMRRFKAKAMEATQHEHSHSAPACPAEQENAP